MMSHQSAPDNSATLKPFFGSGPVKHANGLKKTHSLWKKNAALLVLSFKSRFLRMKSYFRMIMHGDTEQMSVKISLQEKTQKLSDITSQRFQYKWRFMVEISKERSVTRLQPANLFRQMLYKKNTTWLMKVMIHPKEIDPVFSSGSLCAKVMNNRTCCR